MRYSRSVLRNNCLRSTSTKFRNIKDIQATLFPTRRFCVSPKEIISSNNIELEKQLNNELRKEQRILRLPRKIKGSEYIRKSIEQESVEKLNQWEMEKIHINEGIEYGLKITKIIEEYIIGNSEEILNKDWVRNDDLLKEPLQMLKGIRILGMQNHYKGISNSTKNSFANKDISLKTKSTKFSTKESGEIYMMAHSDPFSYMKNNNQDNKRVILNNEINMELLSLSLKRLIIAKKNKQGDLRIENMNLVNEIKIAKSVIL